MMNVIKKSEATYILTIYVSENFKIRVGQLGKVSFKNGDYIFKLDAANNDGLWNGTPVSLNIRINPPWW